MEENKYVIKILVDKNFETSTMLVEEELWDLLKLYIGCEIKMDTNPFLQATLFIKGTPNNTSEPV
jgi:hypothetical protein